MYKSKSTLKCIINVFLVVLVLVIVYFIFLSKNEISEIGKYVKIQPQNDYNVWLIFTKVSRNLPLRFKFHNLLENILHVSSLPLKFHIIVDKESKQLAVDDISDIVTRTNKAVYYKFYDVESCAQEIEDIVQVMTPHFSSKPGTYYSDALFYISLGLHRIALTQKRAILLDCDLFFKKDIALLFTEFDHFKSTALFGLAPELTPVYYHILHTYKLKHNTTFGEFYHKSILTSNTSHPKGFQGYNSGVVLFDFTAIRKSKEYPNLLRKDTVKNLTKTYKFRGHLGDQDFYTLVGYKYPHLIQTLNCGFNRQLCTWWKDHGYEDIFEHYSKCEHPAVVLHGNCNTKIPKN